MSLKTLALAAALATALPGLAQALSMNCDEPGRRSAAPYPSSPIARGDFPSYRRPGLPDWVKERRRMRDDRPRFRTVGAPQPPQRPAWAGERPDYRARSQRPVPPEWVRSRRTTRPLPSYGMTAPNTAPSTAPQTSTGSNDAPAARPGPASRPPAPDRYRSRWSGPRFAGRPGPRWSDRYARFGQTAPPDRSAADENCCRCDRPLPVRPRPFGYGYPRPWPMPAAAPRVASPTVAPGEPAEEQIAKTAPAEQPEPAAAPAATTAAPQAPVDSDSDSVFDAADLCPGTAAGAQVDAFGCEQDAAIVLRGVNFKTDSAELTEESLAILDSVSETLIANPEIKVEVAGHTDSDADAAYNRDLSQRRAESVVAYLAGKGVAADNMTAKGYGEDRPVAGNDSAEGKARNRRVELNRL